MSWMRPKARASSAWASSRTACAVNTPSGFLSDAPECYAAISRSATIVEPLSIGLVTDWCPPRIGGIERHVAGLARALAVRGHAVHLFTTTFNPCPMSGVTIHTIQTAMAGNVAAPALWKVRQLRAALIDCGIDV